ncbi:restriction endonuclease subunit S [Bacillus pumilus]|uniref:restriction endonuclease subunit S n=1 Tax=Bacillus pumilus TaxID=1408 RepID=UPI00228088DE|nr:restriction endonuclease subunit S [Bacillus pumilus]MCY7616680.1 restriction endonuclease subunit S [Bacillus pumilus]
MSGKTESWYEWLPDSWNVKRLKYVVNLRNEKFVGEGIENYIGLENIESKTGRYLPSTNSELNIEGTSNRFYAGDILFGKLRPYLAKCIEADFNGVGTTELLILKVNDRCIFAKYLKLVMLSPKFIDYINSSTYGTKMPRANWEFIGDIEIPFPSITNQQIIVDYVTSKVSRIDELITQKEKLIMLLEEQRQSIITEAVTKGLNPNVKMKNSGVEWIGDIPEHWLFTRLDFVSRVKARLGWKGLKAEEYVEDGYAFLATPNLKERNIDFKNVNYITEERYLESPEIMLEVGDVLLAKDGSTLGIVNVVRSLPKNATVNSSIAVIRPTEKIDSVYFYYYLKSTYIQDVINQIKDGMGVPHLFQADIKKFKILLPPMDEQVVIAKYLDEETLILEQLIGKVKQQIEALKEYRQALIYEAVTGKIDVRDMELN